MASKSLTFNIFGKDVSASKTLEHVGERAKHMGEGVKKLGELVGLAFGATEVVKFGIESVKAFSDAEVKQTQLQDAFKRFPKLADVNIESLRKLNGQLQNKTKFDDDAYASGEAVLAQFNLTGTQVKNLIPIVADYAAKTGTDLPSAASNVGRAFLGNTRALKTLGINFKSTHNTTKDFTSIFKLMKDKVGGFAEQEGKTAAGKLEVLKNRFDDVKEKIGGALMPVLSDLMNFFLSNLLPAFDRMGTWLNDVGIPAIKNFGKWIQQNSGWLSFLALTIGGAIAAYKAYAIVTGVVKAVSLAWTAIQVGLNVALTANPIGIVIVAIGALVGAIIWVATQTHFFQDVWKNMSRFIGDAWNWLWKNALKPVFDFIVGAFNNTMRWGKILVIAVGIMVKQIGGWFGKFSKFVGDAIGGAVKWFQDLPGRILHALSGAVGWLRKVGGDIIAGLIRGVTDAAKNVWKTISTVANNIIKGVKKFFGINSPSTVFAEIGGHLIAGLVKGISRSATQLPHLFGKVFGGVSQTITGALGALGGAGASIWESIFGGPKGGGAFKGGTQRRGAGGASQWAGTVSTALSMLGQSQAFLPGILRRINLESGGNPNAINLWDSNAKAGHPSRGLMQVIPGTFAAYAGPFRRTSITNPLANIYAGMNYAIHRYGSLGAIDPLVRPYGYAAGTDFVPITGSYMVGERGPERVILPRGSKVIPNHALGGGGVNVIIQSKGGIDLSRYIEVKIEQADAKAARRAGQG